MTPQTLLAHHDAAQLWPAATTLDVPAAYQQALAVRAVRVARGEQPRGYKIGFTNRAIWPRYNVFAPIWGTVYSSTVLLCEGQGTLALGGTCQPRIEPEAVFGLRATPPVDASLDQLFDCLDWLAPGFEIVQSHLADWKFAAPDAVADGALHARLLVGSRVPLHALARDAASLQAALAAATVRLHHGDQPIDQGQGSLVLGDPLLALQHFIQELRRCPGAPDLQPGDVVTTGTWTDAWPVAPGQTWVAQFDAPLSRLRVDFVA
jgi:2-keto-4-pentenoate hydratase